MFELITSIYVFWTYIEEVGRIKRIYLTLKYYTQFLRFYLLNPEVRLKYSRKFNQVAYDSEAIENIREAIAEDGHQFGEKTQRSDEMSFSLHDSRLNYHISTDRLSRDEMNILIETKYASYYPIRKFRKLNTVTGKFERICSLIQQEYEMDDEDRIIFAEFEIEKLGRVFHGEKEFEKSSATIKFNEEGFQINELYGNSQNKFLFFLTMKWLLESKKYVSEETSKVEN